VQNFVAEQCVRTSAICYVSRADAVNIKLSCSDLELWRHSMEIWTEFFTCFTHICRVTIIWETLYKRLCWAWRECFRSRCCSTTPYQVRTQVDSFNVTGIQVYNSKTNVFWDAVPCYLLEIRRRIRGAYYLHRQSDEWALIMEVLNTFETLVDFYQTIRRNIPEDSHLHTCRYDNMNSQNSTNRIKFLLK
jgi:hypothetical protein